MIENRRKRPKKGCFLALQGWHDAHYLGFLKAPHFDVKHLKIRPEA